MQLFKALVIEATGVECLPIQLGDDQALGVDATVDEDEAEDEDEDVEHENSHDGQLMASFCGGGASCGNRHRGRFGVLALLQLSSSSLFVDLRYRGQLAGGFFRDVDVDLRVWFSFPIGALQFLVLVLADFRGF